MTLNFTEATVVTSLGGNRFGIDLDDNWTVMGKPNGGYLMAVMARAVEAQLRIDGVLHPFPVAGSALYASVPDCGSAEMRVEILRSGRSASQAHVILEQGGVAQVTGQFTFGGLDHEEDPRYAVHEAISVPPIEECFRLPAVNPSGFTVGILEGSEQHMDPATLGWTGIGEAGQGEIRGWVRFQDGRDFDPFSLLFVGDCFPPATFNLGSVGWVPTLQLSVYVRALPAPGPLRVRQAITVVHGRLVDEVCHVIDAEGTLVAQATQLAQARFA
ncbi:MAG: thioesterase family protein [Actinomycetes bacterium]